jgi:hypothetical protein
MPKRYRSSAALDLVKAIQDAGGTVERVGRGKLRITGPAGVMTIHEPSTETRRDLRQSSAWRKITEQTGLTVERN